MLKLLRKSVLTGGIAAFLLINSTAGAQSGCATPCPAPRWLPISGSVVDALDGHPIAGATIRYSGRGSALKPGTTPSAPNFEPGPISKPAIPMDSLLNPPTIRGEVKTGTDGKFVLPQLVPGGFTVRVTAPGYLGSVESMFENPAGYRPPPPTPLPASICMARQGVPTCYALAAFDGTFRMHADALLLQPMSTDAMAAFAPSSPNFGFRGFIGAGFGKGGERLGFVTLETVSQMGEPLVQQCVAWTYNLASGALSKAKLFEKTIPAGQYEQETECSSIKNVAWQGDGFYLASTTAEHPALVEWVQGSEATRIADTRQLPDEIRKKIAVRLEDEPIKTSDGPYTVGLEATGDENQPHGGCIALTATSARAPQHPTVLTGCGDIADYLVDQEHGLVYFTGPGASLHTVNDRQDPHGSLVEYNLATGVKRSFLLPAYGRNPKLLAIEAIDGGATRVAFTFPQPTQPMVADCDPAGSEFYPWPMQMIRSPGDYRPDENGHAPVKFSVCFVTVPPSVP